MQKSHKRSTKTKLPVIKPRKVSQEVSVFGESDRVQLLRLKPLSHLEQSEVQTLLDLLCRRDPVAKRNYEEYKRFGRWDMRFIN